MCSFVWSFDQNLIPHNLRCLLTWRVEGIIFWENRFWELLDYLGERYKGKLGNKCSSVQKPPFADVRQNRCSQKFRNIYRKTLVLESLFNEVAGWGVRRLFLPILADKSRSLFSQKSSFIDIWQGPRYIFAVEFTPTRIALNYAHCIKCAKI